MPVINENDTTATDEISFGDNDFLAAQVAVLIGANELVLLTDIDGLFTADPRLRSEARLIESVSDFAALEDIEVGHTTSPLGSGGMRSKVVAADMATAAGIATTICNGLSAEALEAVLAGGRAGTRFEPREARYSSFKLWLKYAKPARGTLVVDRGAARALGEGSASLLPVGVVAVEGEFDAGDAVAIALEDRDGAAAQRPIGKGICNYSARELRQVKGLQVRRRARAAAARQRGGRASRLPRARLTGRAVARVYPLVLMATVASAVADVCRARQARRRASWRSARQRAQGRRAAGDRRRRCARAPTRSSPRTRRTCGPGARRASSDALLDRLRLDERRIEADRRRRRADRRARRPGRRGDRRTPAGQRPGRAQGARAARRGRGRVRGAPERHDRRDRAVPEVGQRDRAARLLARPPTPTPRSPRSPAKPSWRRAAAGRGGLLAGGGREDLAELATQNDTVDLIIPRGGEGLKAALQAWRPCPSSTPRRATATSTSTPAPTSSRPRRSCSTPRSSARACATPPRRCSCTRPSPTRSCPRSRFALEQAGVQLRGDERTRAHARARGGGRGSVDGRRRRASGGRGAGGWASGAAPGQPSEDWETEYLAPTWRSRVVDSLEQAIEHIARYGSGHSEAIVTRDTDAARAFQLGVDAACVYVNASTRFTDGGEFGMGAEIGNSTQKLHARGPIGLRELCTFKYLIQGDGQIRDLRALGGSDIRRDVQPASRRTSRAGAARARRARAGARVADAGLQRAAQGVDATTPDPGSGCDVPPGSQRRPGLGGARGRSSAAGCPIRWTACRPSMRHTEAELTFIVGADTAPRWRPGASHSGC